MNNRNVLTLWTIFAAMLITACGGDSGDPSGPVVNPLESLAGSWSATSFKLEPLDAPDLGVFDQIAAGGTMRVDISLSGEVVLTTVGPGAAGPDVDVGTVRVTSGTKLEILIPGDAPLLLDFSVVGNTLSLNGRTTVDVEGFSGAADLTATFVRR